MVQVSMELLISDKKVYIMLIIAKVLKSLLIWTMSTEQANMHLAFMSPQTCQTIAR